MLIKVHHRLSWQDNSTKHLTSPHPKKPTGGNSALPPSVGGMCNRLACVRLEMPQVCATLIQEKEKGTVTQSEEIATAIYVV